MARELRCTGCNRYLGSITKARLLKDIVYLCHDCEKVRRLSIKFLKKEAPDDPNINSFFNYLTGRGAK